MGFRTRTPGGRGPFRILALTLTISAIGLWGCGNQRVAGDAGAKGRDIILLFDSDQDGANAKLPSFVAMRTVVDGKTPFADRLDAAIPTASTAGTAPFVVAMNPQKGFVDAAFKFSSSGRAIDWILVSPSDDPLAAEAVADLVVDVDPSQTLDANFENALERGLCELARRVSTGKARADDAAEIAAALRSAGGYAWTVSYRVDPATGVKAKNHVVLSAQPRR
ncbi:MAG TPA: hypothetical protein VMV83_09760 [Rectinemataceae bacterium]|nr:hypothetical protein [Rectinemataceae bacterium]